VETIGNEKRIATICKIPAEGGEAQKIMTESAHVTEAGLDWSPDGKTIAYFSKKTDAPAGTLNLVPIAGGESREICPVQNVNAQSDVSWSPDGQKIAFVSRGKIWVVPAAGGEPVEVKTDVDADAGKLDWSPDGRKIAFSGDSGMDIEFWFMEDFLHLLKK
jgi:tricorn protease